MAPASLTREGASLEVACGNADRRDGVCGEVTVVRLDQHDVWQAATDADRDRLDRHGERVEVLP